MEIPIACTLDVPTARQRIDRWRDLLSRAVARSDRPAPDRLACELHADLADLRALALLAQEEKACCQFFSFSFEVEADSVTMVVGVPSSAIGMLDQFATLTSTA